MGRLVLLYLVVPCGAVLVLACCFQRSLIYRPTKVADLSVVACNLEREGITDIRLSTDSGSMIQGWLVAGRRRADRRSDQGRAEHPRDVENRERLGQGDGKIGDRADCAGLLIFFPGNAGHRLRRWDEVRELASTGFDLLIFDYRGYGDNSGRPTESALTADARAIFRHAIDELGYQARDIVVYGESLGGAVALSLWSDGPLVEPPRHLLLRATFTSLPEVASWHYPLLPCRLVLIDRWPSARRISAVHCPITIVHGTEDEIVPIDHGNQLADRAKEVKFVPVAGYGHNDLPISTICTQLRAIARGASDGDDSVGGNEVD